MARSDFQTLSYGKCILAGEHTVLRGGWALVAPLLQKRLEFHWSDEAVELQVEFLGKHGSELQMIFFTLLEEAAKKAGVSRSELRGRIRIANEIPLGTGLGASAAICVAVTRWFVHLGKVSEQKVFEFARELENLFHGESSGVDIAVALAGKPILFHKTEGIKEFNPAWWPNWYLEYSGKRGVTIECVKKVRALNSESPELGEQIDLQMKNSVEQLRQALSLPKDEGLPLLVAAMAQAADCFKSWGLSESPVLEKLQSLQEKGAIAVKPTGSGGGGFILHLWDNRPTSTDAAWIPLVLSAQEGS